MKTRKIGKNGATISAIGLCCMGMSDLYEEADRKESFATIHAALESAVPKEAVAGTRYRELEMNMLDSERWK